MKRIKIIAAFLSAALAGCGLQTETNPPSKKQDTFEGHVDSGIPSFPDIRASLEQSEDTRTILDEDGIHVLWEPSDELYVLWDRGQTIRYKSKIQEPSSTAVFSPDYSTLTSGYNTNYTVQCHTLSAFYPIPANNENNTLILGGEDPWTPFYVKFKLPASQKGEKDSFHSQYMPAWSLADADDPNGIFNFFFICGGVRFSVAQDGIKAVVFKNREGLPLAGTGITVVIGNDKRPKIQSVDFGVDSVKVTAPGDAFIPGKYYFAVMLPQRLERGLSVSYLKEHQSATVGLDHPITVRRARFGILNELDKNLVFEESLPSSIPDGIITFMDSYVKSIMLTYFDTDGDGEISYAEADAVTSLEFLEPKWDMSPFYLAESFDELQYFTGLTDIPTRLFINCKRLRSISFPPHLETIGEECFINCKLLRTVHFSNSIKTIERAAFKGCSSLTAIQLPTSLQVIDPIVFAECSALETIRLPDDLHNIRSSAFSHCTSLRKIVFPPSLQSLEGYAFSDCTALSEVELPDSITEMDEKAFFGCSHIRTIIIGSIIDAGPSHVMGTDVGFIKTRFGSQVENIVLSEQVTRIPELTFADCSLLQTVQLPAGLRIIGKKAFAGSGITSIAIPQGIREIPDSCFARCRSLSSAVIPESVTTIGRKAFYVCSVLDSVELPDHLSVLGSDAFSYCPQMCSVLFKSPVPPENKINDAAGDMGDRFEHNPCWIYVPDEAVETYKADPYFTKYAQRIRPLSSYTVD